MPKNKMTDYGYMGTPDRSEKGPCYVKPAPSTLEPCPACVGTKWRIVATQSENGLWWWHLCPDDKDKLLRARDSNNAIIITTREDDQPVLKAIALTSDVA